VFQHVDIDNDGMNANGNVDSIHTPVVSSDGSIEWMIDDINFFTVINNS
jgi:hypothetical protein